jgi:tetratricopeptide (TPR) repeat protein
MTLRTFRLFAGTPAVVSFLLAGLLFPAAYSQTSDKLSKNQSSSSQSSSSQPVPQEKAPSLIDPAGPTISLVSSEPVFLMAAALNACGYDEGLPDSAPIRQHVRDEINQALAKSEEARASRDRLCLYIAQHRMTGTEHDISQYISLALYLTPPPEMEISEDLAEMPPDSTQVVEIVPLLKNFVNAVDLQGIWLAIHPTYDKEADKLHDALSRMIVETNLYLKMPADTNYGRRFLVVIEPMLSPSVVNARVYGTDFIVVLSPVNGQIRMTDVRHTYLHYVIEPLLNARANAIDRTQPILKEVREAPMEFRFRSDTVPLTIECLIKAIEARTNDTGIPKYQIPANVDRSEMPRYEHERQLYQQKVDAVRWGWVQHDMKQGFVLTQYFYEQLVEFEKDPASLKDTIGEMVYSMDVDQQVHRARNIEFDKESDGEVLGRSKPRKLTGLDLAESKLVSGDPATAASLAQQALADHSDSLDVVAAGARANFILARVAIMKGNPEEAIDRFQKTLATSKDQRLLAWSHIFLGRMLDLDCKRDEAVSEYQAALTVRDGQQDTRLAAERGTKKAYAVNGHSCDEDSDDDSSGTGGAKPAPVPSQTGASQPQPTEKPQ